MANWSVKATAAVQDPNNGANIIITFVATNSVTNEVVPQDAPSANWTEARVQTYAQGMIDGLNQRDAAKAASDANLPVMQAFVALDSVLAAG